MYVEDPNPLKYDVYICIFGYKSGESVGDENAYGYAKLIDSDPFVFALIGIQVDPDGHEDINKGLFEGDTWKKPAATRLIMMAYTSVVTAKAPIMHTKPHMHTISTGFAW